MICSSNQHREEAVEGKQQLRWAWSHLSTLVNALIRLQMGACWSRHTYPWLSVRSHSIACARQSTINLPCKEAVLLPTFEVCIVADLRFSTSRWITQWQDQSIVEFANLWTRYPSCSIAHLLSDLELSNFGLAFLEFRLPFHFC
jgi:hypothetical protein